MDLLINFIWEFLLYTVGYWALKAITLGRFEDKDGSLWVSLLGLILTALAGIGLYFILRS